MKRPGTLTTEKAQAIINELPEEVLFDAVTLAHVWNWQCAVQESIQPFDPEAGDEKVEGDALRERALSDYSMMK